MSCVKISNTCSPKAVIAIKDTLSSVLVAIESVIPVIGVVHNSNAYIFEDIV